MPRARSKKYSEDSDLNEINETVLSSVGRRRGRIPRRYLDDSPPIESPVTVPTPVIPTPSRKPVKKGRPRNPKNPSKKPWDKDGLDEALLEPDFESASESSSDEDEEFKPYTDLYDEEDLDLTEFKADESLAAISCPWVEFDQEKIPPFHLPESSQDLPISSNMILDIVELYEILRTYHRTLHLKPFTFEDFVAAMHSEENSCILAETHIALLKMCLRNDDDEQILYSVVDTNISFNALIQCLESMTYGEILRQYIRAWPGAGDEVIAAISAENYPYVDVEKRLVVLLFLCYRFLNSHDYKKIAASLGKLPAEDACRSCGKTSGKLIGCTICEAAMHLTCVSKDGVTDVIVCENCERNEVHGVTDALPIGEEKDRESLRMTPIGRDRHGRIYWFVVRRIFIQSDDESELRYYSSAPQFYELIRGMDPSYFEHDLCQFFNEHMTDIFEQMSHTLEITMEVREKVTADVAKRPPTTQDVMASFKIAYHIYLNEDNKRRLAPILRSLAAREMVKKEEETNTSVEESLVEKVVEMMGICEGRLLNSFWAGSLTEEELLNYGVSELPTPIDATKTFRLGDPTCENNYHSYRNHYVTSDVGESAATKKKVADRKRYLCNKLYFQDDKAYAFDWSMALGQNMYGAERLHLRYVEWGIKKLSTKIPLALMHQMWPLYVNKFNTDLKNANSYKKLAEMLAQLEVGIRRPIFQNHWWSSLGHIQLSRTCAEQREFQSKEIVRKKKEENELFGKDIDETVIKVNYTKTNGPNQAIARMKGESYRIGGKNGEMGGWLWLSSTRMDQEDTPPLPACYHSQGPSKKSQEETNVVIEEKRTRLEDVVSAIWVKKETLPKNGDNGHEAEEVHKRENGKTVKGENEPWPLLKPHTFSTRSGKKSIFVLPNKTLKHLAKTGGTRAYYIPGFSSNAKMNLSVWNYPAARPCMDQCWKYLITEVTSLHAVALQLKLLWSSIRWMDMEPLDDDNDRRVVISLPDYDERREIIGHKEFPPYGYYERYRLRIEIFAIDDHDDDDQDDAWSKAKEREPNRKEQKRRSSRKKESIRHLKGEKTEWIDGVELKLFEIADYWEEVNPNIEKRAPPPLPMLQTTSSYNPLRFGSRGTPSVTEERRKRVVTKISNPDYVYDNDDQYNADPTASPPAKRKFVATQNAYHPPEAVRYTNNVIQPRPTKSYINTMALKAAHYGSSNNIRPMNAYYYQNGINTNAPGSSRVYHESVGDCSSSSLMAFEEGINGNSSGPQSDADDGPPQIPKYDTTGQPHPVARPVQHRQVVYTPGTNNVARKGQVFVVKRAVDSAGIKQVAIRAPAGQDSRIRPVAPGSIVVHSGNQQRLVVRNAPIHAFARPPNQSPQTIVRLSANSTRSMQPVRRMIVAGQDDGKRGYVVAQPARSKFLPHQPGGVTLNQMQEARVVVPSKTKKLASYKEFIDSRIYSDGGRYVTTGRPYFTTFDFNDQEERDIAAAIAKEEELMKMEESNKSIYDGLSILKPRVPYVSNLIPLATDSPDEKIIKQVLDGILSHVSKPEKPSWPYPLSNDMRRKLEAERFQLRKPRINQRELMLAEHQERLKKEINKRRTRLENEAEILCGMPTPWRKSKAKTHRGSRMPKERVSSGAPSQSISSAPRQVVNPADISLGGDSVDWTRKPAKEEPKQKSIKENETGDSIAVSVARRRRNSTLSKDDGEDYRKRKEKTGEEVQRKRRRTPSRTSDNELMDTSICQDCGIACDEARVSVTCDMCKNVYHGDCVGLTEKQASKLNGWTCNPCVQEARRVRESPQLYCVCQTPYDDSKFYVGCDACEDWFHPDCVGTKQQYCEKLEHYICPMCAKQQEERTNQGYESCSSEGSVDSKTSTISTNLLTRHDYKYLVQLNDVLNDHHMSRPFKQPVDLSKHPDYLSVVRRPVDLSMITEKIQALEYRTLREFSSDVQQMFDNAKVYNTDKDSGIFQCAEVLEEIFEGKLAETKAQIRAENTVRNRNVSECRTLDGSLDIDTDQLLPVHIINPQFLEEYLEG